MVDPLDPALFTDYYPGELTILETQQEEPARIVVNSPSPRGNGRASRRAPLGLTLSPESALNKHSSDCTSSAPTTPSKLSASFKRHSFNLAHLIRHPTSIRNRSSSRVRSPESHPESHPTSRPSNPAATLSPHPSPLLTPSSNIRASHQLATSPRASLSPISRLSWNPVDQPMPHPQQNSSAAFCCRCCGRSILLDHSHSSIGPVRCSVCAIIWDSPQSFLTNQSTDTITPAQPSPSSSTALTITDEHIARLNSLSLSQDLVDSFDHDPSGFLDSIPADSELGRLTKEFDQLAHELLSQLFSSLPTLSTAFLTQPTAAEPPTVDLERLHRFYQAICSGPTGRDVLFSLLFNFLQRPGTPSVHFLASFKPNSEAQPIAEPHHWVWVIVLLQCPLLSPSSKIHPHKRIVITARILGLISCLPNSVHHRLVSFLIGPHCSTKLFADKVELVNLFIGDRIRHFLQIPNGFGSGSQQREPHDLPKYMHDWSLVAASRVMALLSGSNAQSGKLPITSFYNVSADLIQPIDLVFDFETWESRKSPYTLCGYPYLLSMANKISLLTYDGKRQMGLEARQAFIDGLLGRSLAPPVFPLSIRRSHLVEDSLRQISSSQSELKKLLKISFVDEDGVDGGGLKKEWFLLLIRQLVAPEYGMFLHDHDHHQIWFNPASQEFEEFRLIGTVLGLAIYNRATLDFGLPLIGYRKLLGHRVGGLSDLATLKPDVAKSLRWLLKYDGEDFEEICGRNFVGDYDGYGTVVEVPLMPNGENIPVTKSNRAEFVKLYCDFVLNKSIAAQFKAFSDGFRSVAAGNGLSLFQPEEIELLVVGSTYTTKLPVEELKAITTYEGFQPTDLTIQNFWVVVDCFSFEDQKKLLRFITGTDRIPAVGISGLNLKITKSVHSSSPSIDDSNTHSSHNHSFRRRHPRPSTSTSGSVKAAQTERIPESHTCFNQLILSPFSSVESLDQKLRLAINESEGFGLS